MDITSFGLRFMAPLILPRCPHCGVAKPNLQPAWHQQFVEGMGGFAGHVWGTFRCNSCNQFLLAAGVNNVNANNAPVAKIYPGMRRAAGELPDAARTFLQQAYDTLHAPDASAVMAGSAVDAMLKAKGFEKGSLYERIDQAVANHTLTKEMGDWAHWVRLGSNRPRHADKDKPHVTVDEARQSVEFTEALGQFLFVLSTRIAKGIDEAKKI